MTLITPADFLLYWLAAAALAFAFGTGVLRRWVLGRPGVRRGVVFVAAFIAAALVAGLLPSAMINALKKNGGGWVGPVAAIGVMIRDLIEYGGDEVTPEAAAMWSAALVTGVVGLGVLARAAVGDPSRGRRRCGRCWYDMSATPATTCPECGRTARSEKRLFRTRRRKRGFVVAALLLAASTTCGSLPWLSSGDWKAQVPDTVLVALLPYLGDDSSLLEELHGRVHGQIQSLEGPLELPPGRWRRFAARRALAAMEGKSQGYRVEVALSLAFVLGDDVAVVRDRALALLEDGSPTIRVSALLALGRCMNDDEVRTAVEAALSDPDPYVRKHAAWSLGVSISGGIRPTAPPCDALLAVALHDPDPAARHGALQMLGFHERSDRSVEVLLAATTDPLASIRSAALSSLCRLAPDAPECISARTAALQDTESQVTDHAAYLVGLHGPHDEATIDLLLAMADSDDSSIRWTAMNWLAGLSRTDDGADAAILERALRVREPMFRERVLQLLLAVVEPPESLRLRLLELKEIAQQDPEGAAHWGDEVDTLLGQFREAETDENTQPQRP